MLQSYLCWLHAVRKAEGIIGSFGARDDGKKESGSFCKLSAAFAKLYNQDFKFNTLNRKKCLRFWIIVIALVTVGFMLRGMFILRQ